MRSDRLFSRDFTLMILGQIISLFGNAILRFALSLYVLDTTGSAAAFGGILAVSMVPTILCSPWGASWPTASPAAHHVGTGLLHRRPGAGVRPVLCQPGHGSGRRGADGAPGSHSGPLPALGAGQHTRPGVGGAPARRQRRGGPGTGPGQSAGPHPGRYALRLGWPAPHGGGGRGLLLLLGCDGALSPHPLPSDEPSPARRWPPCGGISGTRADS